MRRIGIIFFSLLALCSYGNNRGPEKEPLITTVPEKLQLFVNQKTDPYTIPVNYTLNIPVHTIPSKGYLLYVPYFTNEQYEYLLQPIIVYGKDFQDKNKPLKIPGQSSIDLTKIRSFESKEEDLQITVRDTVPFQLWMAQSQLIVTIVSEDKQKEKFSTLILAEGVSYLPEGPGPVRVRYVEKKVNVCKEADFHVIYPTNVSFVNTEKSENRNQLDQLKKFLNQLSHNPEDTLKQIIITGYCSPDGSLSYNERLARKRANNFLPYLEKSLPHPMQYVKIKTVARDWQGFQKLIEQTDIKNKAAILNLLNKPLNDRQKCTALRNLPGYSYLLNQIYPQLQQTRCVIYYTTKELKTVPEPE